jgi:hypothetical protein
MAARASDIPREALGLVPKSARIAELLASLVGPAYVDADAVRREEIERERTSGPLGI